MEEIIVMLIVAMAALSLFGRLRKTLSGKGGCGCGCGGCRTMPKRTLTVACSGCTSQQCGSCSKEISRIG